MICSFSDHVHKKIFFYYSRERAFWETLYDSLLVLMRSKKKCWLILIISDARATVHTRRQQRPANVQLSQAWNMMKSRRPGFFCRLDKFIPPPFRATSYWGKYSVPMRIWLEYFSLWRIRFRIREFAGEKNWYLLILRPSCLLDPDRNWGCRSGSSRPKSMQIHIDPDP